MCIHSLIIYNCEYMRLPFASGAIEPSETLCRFSCVCAKWNDCIWLVRKSKRQHFNNNYHNQSDVWAFCDDLKIFVLRVKRIDLCIWLIVISIIHLVQNSKLFVRRKNNDTALVARQAHLIRRKKEKTIHIAYVHHLHSIWRGKLNSKNGIQLKCLLSKEVNTKLSDDSWTLAR